MASRLAEAHIEAERRLRLLTVQAVGRIWEELPAYNRDDIGPWLTVVMPLILAAQRQSVALTDAYIARALERQPIGLDYAAVTGAATRNGVSPEEVYSRPFVSVWTALEHGVAYEDAVHKGMARAQGMAAFDVQASMRDTLVKVGEADETIWGYQRVADPDACAFCQMVNGAQFRTSTPAPLHNYCGCGFEPVVYTRGGDNANALDAFNAEPTPIPESVAVHEHGEMGPVLTGAHEHFTSESELH